MDALAVIRQVQHHLHGGWLPAAKVLLEKQAWEREQRLKQTFLILLFVKGFFFPWKD